MFPPELVEKILYYCDGCTLFRARGVSRLWKQRADYLIRKKDQMTLCCEREICDATLSELSTEQGDCKSRYRAWYRHSRLAHWPVIQMPPMEMASAGAMTVTCIDGDCMVVAASAGGAALFDLFGNLLYQLPYCETSFPIQQLEVSRPTAGLDYRRLLVLVYSNNVVRVGGFWHEEPSTMSPPVPLLTREGNDLTVSVCEDTVCVSYPSEAWLYRVQLGKGMVDASTLCVVDLRSADGLFALARCCHYKMAYVALRGGDLVWCDASEHSMAGVLGSLPYPAVLLTPRQGDLPDDAAGAAPLQPDHLQALHFNTVNLVASLGTEVLLGHVEWGCRTVDTFPVLRSRVSACLLHGRLLLLGTENGTLAVYFVPNERALLEVDLARPAGRLQLGHEPLRRLFVVDQAETVRVLAQDTAGCLHHCYWRRPGAGYLPSHEPSEPLRTRWLLFPYESPPNRW